MSEAVILALIGLIDHAWTSLVSNIGAFSAGAIALGTFVMQAWSRHQDKKERRQAEESRTELSCKVDAVTDRVETVRMEASQVKEHMDLVAKGAERKGFEIGKQQATGPGPIGK